MTDSSYELVLSVKMSGYGRPEDTEKTRAAVERSLRATLHRPELSVEIASVTRMTGVPRAPYLLDDEATEEVHGGNAVEDGPENTTPVHSTHPDEEEVAHRR